MKDPSTEILLAFYTALNGNLSYNEPGSDLAVNGSFEDWTAGDPDNWAVTENGSGTVTEETTIKTLGNSSAKLYNPAGGGNTVSILQTYAGTIGTSYKLTLKIRSNTASRTIKIYSFDGLGGVGNLDETPALTTANIWYTFTYTFTWGSDDDGIRILTNSNGSFYIDEVMLQELTATDYPVYTIAPKSEGYNYVLLDDVELLDSSMKQTDYDLEGSILIDIVTAGSQDNASLLAANDIADDLLQLVVKQNLSMSNFTFTVTPFLDLMNILKKKTDTMFVVRKLIRLKFWISQN